MLKKNFGILFLIILIVALIIGINGCGKEQESKPSSQAQAPAPAQAQPQPQPQPQPEAVNSSVAVIEEVPILYYHSVLLEEGNEVRMPPEQFEAQLRYMRDQGYESITLDQLYQAFYKGGGLPAKPFVITFDDGYVDNYTIAFPILKKYGFTGTVFMVSSYVNGEGFLSWSQLKELKANGWEIEGHTVNHPYLSQIDKATVVNELKTSKEILEKELGQTVDFFAYPYGDLNSEVVKALKETGYRMAFTTNRGWANTKLDEWHIQRVYCFANMGLNEFSRRLKNPNY